MAGQSSTDDGGSFDPPLAPSIDGAEVELLDLPAHPVDVSAGFPFQVTFRNIPPGSGVSVSIIRNVPHRVSAYPSSGATLTLEAVPIEGSGSVDLRFIGMAASIPTDAPQFYPVDPGEYRLFATVTNPPVLDMPMRRPPPFRILAQTLSPPVRLTGPLNTSSRSPLTRAFVQKLVRQHGLYSGPWDLKDYYTVAGVEQSAERLCFRYALQPPFAGVVRACIPASYLSAKGLSYPRREEIEIIGDMPIQPGTIPFREASAAALRAFESLPSLGTGTVAPQAPRLKSWIYRSSEGAWLFKVVRSSGGGVFDGDHAVVSVADDGTTRILEHRPGYVYPFPD